MDFRISQLRGFIALAEHLQHTSAARALSINQATLIFRISSLEDSLRVKLFVRARKGLSLTEAGSRFYNYARTIIDITEQAHMGMGAFRTPSSSFPVAPEDTGPLDKLRVQ